MATLKLLTFNIFGRYCKFFDKFEEKLNPYKPDIICTQESLKHSTNLKLGSYNSINSAGTNSEIVGVFSNGDPQHINDFIKISTYGGPYHVANRHAILFTYNGVKIANLHLEGGRYSDQGLFNNFNKLLNYKLDLLKQVIAEKPDIILGDFNSVYSSNKDILQSYLEGQYNYFKKAVLRQQNDLTQDQKNIVNKWNSEPYELLKTAGYAYAVPDNEKEAVTNGRGNSIIDTIWYNPVFVTLIKSHIQNTILSTSDNYNASNCISDHNPVYAEFRLLNDMSLKKSINLNKAVTVIKKSIKSDNTVTANSKPINLTKDATPNKINFIII